MKMNEKRKKRLAIGGCVVIGIALAAAIGLQFQKTPTQADVLPPESTESSEVTVAPPETTPPTVPSTEGKEVTVTVPSTTTAPESTQAVDSRPAQTDQTEQSIQPEATKPVVTEEQKKDMTQKPNGEAVSGEPEVVDHDTYTPPVEEPKPNGGLPGFDHVPDAGANQVIPADDMYENGNKIGDMG